MARRESMRKRTAWLAKAVAGLAIAVIAAGLVLGRRCSVHGVWMGRETVRIQYGLIVLPREYCAAREALFPHPGDPVLGGCLFDRKSPRETLVDLCPRCREVRDRWDADQER